MSQFIKKIQFCCFKGTTAGTNSTTSYVTPTSGSHGNEILITLRDIADESFCSFHVNVARKYIPVWAQLQVRPIVRILLFSPSLFIRQNFACRTI